jgi:hypothetical protein
MPLDEPFPLEAVPSQVRHAVLREFNGRRPSLREIDQIPDKHWLATPGIGPAYLGTIRNITNAARGQEVSHASAHSLSDAELLRRLEGFQEDLHWLECQLKARMPKEPRRNRHRQWHGHAAQNQTGLSGHELGDGQASDYRSDQGQSG